MAYNYEDTGYMELHVCVQVTFLHVGTGHYDNVASYMYMYMYTLMLYGFRLGGGGGGGGGNGWTQEDLARVLILGLVDV